MGIWILLGLIVSGIALSLWVHGFGRLVMWSVIGFVGSLPFRGGRILVLLFLFVLLLEGTYWLAMPRSNGGDSN